MIGLNGYGSFQFNGIGWTAQAQEATTPVDNPPTRKPSSNVPTPKGSPVRKQPGQQDQAMIGHGAVQAGYIQV